MRFRPLPYKARSRTVSAPDTRQQHSSRLVMPPLPTTFEDATNASIASIQRRQHDLREFQIPRLRGCSESLTVQQQYAAELREDLETVTRLVEVSMRKTLLYIRASRLSVGIRRNCRHPAQSAQSERPPWVSRRVQSGHI